MKTSSYSLIVLVILMVNMIRVWSFVGTSSLSKLTTRTGHRRSLSRISRLCMISFSSHPLRDELLVALDSARKAAIVAKQLQTSLLQEKKSAISKTDSSPVTIADFSVQALVVSEIRRSFPRDQVVAEENSNVLRQDVEALKSVTEIVSREGRDGLVTTDDVCRVLDHGRTLETRTWILDPIDGTKGFIRGEHFCVALGLALEGEPVLGVLACPNLPFRSSRENDAILGEGCVFFALKGQGAFVLPLIQAASSGQSGLEEEISKHAVPIHVSNIRTGEASRFFESVEAAHSSHSVAGKVTQELGVVSPPVRLDSQCKYGMLARGEGEIMLRLPRAGYVENIWDHAPAYVVISEAGGAVTDTAGKPLDFSAGCRTGDGKLGKEVTGIVTTNGLMHDKVLAALGKSWPSSSG